MFNHWQCNFKTCALIKSLWLMWDTLCNISDALLSFYSTWVKLIESLGYLRAGSHAHNHSRWSAATGLNVSQRLCFSCKIIDQHLSRAIVNYHVKRLCTNYFSNYWIIDCLSSFALVNEGITHASKDHTTVVHRNISSSSPLLTSMYWLTCFCWTRDS